MRQVLVPSSVQLGWCQRTDIRRQCVWKVRISKGHPSNAHHLPTGRRWNVAVLIHYTSHVTSTCLLPSEKTSPGMFGAENSGVVKTVTFCLRAKMFLTRRTALNPVWFFVIGHVLSSNFFSTAERGSFFGCRWEQ